MPKTALITGASAGIGLELARVFARNGDDVVLVARRVDRLHDIAARLRADNAVTAHVAAADLAAPGGAAALHDEVTAQGIEIDYLVNNAGFGTFGPFHETPVERSMELVRLNIGALTELTGLVLPSMVERRSGKVLNVASAAAFQPGPLMATYYASKAYVLHFSEAIAVELEGTGVTVTALCPGAVRTEFHAVADMEASGLVHRRKLISVEEVAEAGYRAMMRGRPVEVPGTAQKALSVLARLAPRRIVTRVVRRMQAKRAS